jgi:thiol-disulfide isomerase/thioredoxin
MTTLIRGIAVIGLSMLLIYPQVAQAFIGRTAPEIISPVWINSDPQSLSDLRGKVVMVEFWTFGCYNCRNVEPQIKKWHRTYADRGLVVIGIHTPEFSYEKAVDAVKSYVQEKKIPYAVAIDNDFTIWNQYQNHYWPAIYLIDKQGVIRYIRVGEGSYAETERMIQNLLAETQSATVK